ncbi:PaREP1 family protein [Saccharolobus caldissimus]|uniref:Uncharacterized protein n=1 Tax=Saccharolobus islandicus (strain M.16.4 / Kamchatka \|nr:MULTISPECIES: PaREP1 family protein [Sulfolobaceae]ACR41436.1 hypothetical protein M164_2800 [Sulfolobus islandicus M.16.4]
MERHNCKFSRTLGSWILNEWNASYSLHVWGSHEAKLSVNDNR